jgi:hypothetical protein
VVVLVGVGREGFFCTFYWERVRCLFRRLGKGGGGAGLGD